MGHAGGAVRLPDTGRGLPQLVDREFSQTRLWRCLSGQML